jgi:exopolysaccharide biosynthesis polyprenyl glycosylphosphotransferase
VYGCTLLRWVFASWSGAATAPAVASFLETRNFTAAEGAEEVMLGERVLYGNQAAERPGYPSPFPESLAVAAKPEPAASDRPARAGRRGWLIRRALAAADVLGLVAAFLVADWFFGYAAEGGSPIGPWSEYLLLLLSLPAWIVVAKLSGLYDHDEERTDHSTADDLGGIFHLATVWAWVAYAGAYLIGVTPSFDRLLAFWITAVVLVTSARAAARALCRRHHLYVQRTLIVGAGEVGRRVAEKLRRHPEYRLDIVGFVDDRPYLAGECSELADGCVVADRADLERLIDELDVARVIVAFSNESGEETLGLVRSLREISDIQVDIVPRLFELIAPGVTVHSVEGLPLVGLPRARLSRSSALLKRTLDLALLAVCSVILVPLFAVVALAIKLDSPGPVFFRQVRRGRGETTFSVWKFRTMWQDADRRKAEFAHLNKHNGGDPRMFKIENDPRVTKVGRVLRRLSLDELPQLINVARGEMSLVGPRPLILEEDQFVADWGRTRLDIQPGITGLWQVLGRSDIPFEEMVRMDYVYVTSWSLWRDLKLIAQTVPALVRSGDA